MAVTNPATAPAATPVEGDNLTAQQAALVLAVFENDPKAVLDQADALEMSEDDVDNLLGMLSEMAGEDDEAVGEDETDPNEPGEEEPQ